MRGRGSCWLMKIKHRSNKDDSALVSVIPDPLLRQLMANRGVTSQEDLDNSLSSLLPPTLQDINQAAEQIAHAIMQQQHILIAGDYDVDGMTGTALGVRCLQAFGLPREKIHYYVPSRYGSGYGINPEVVQLAQRNGVQLILTVDNGIAAFAAANEAQALGIPMVITDHHEVQDNQLPMAVAVVDPKRSDDTFASKNLCGVGVLFYVLCATRARLVELGYYADRSQAPNMSQFLDLVCLGTIGDVMPLDSNNRRLVKGGLKRIQAGQASLGIMALIQNLKLNIDKLNTKNVAFDLCPRFNAATRIKLEENPAIDLLLCNDPEQAHYLALKLDQCNKRRMDHEKLMSTRALELYEAHMQELEAEVAAAASAATANVASTNTATAVAAAALANTTTAATVASEQDDITPAGIVIYDPCFMSGLVGLVANRMKEREQKPCVVFGANVGCGRLGGTQVMLHLNHAADMKQVVNTPYFEELELMQDSNSYDEALQEYIRDMDPETEVTGSARSIESIDLMEVFAYIKQQAPEILVHFGGHRAAAGASIKIKDIPLFTKLFAEGCALAQHGTNEGNEFVSDGVLPDSHLSLEFARTLEELGPWGNSYEEPTFDGFFTIDSVKPLKERHMKYSLRSEDRKLRVDAIKFRATSKEKDLQPNSRVQVLYKLNVDRYRGESLQLTIDAIESAQV